MTASTLDMSALMPGVANRVWLIELDTEHGRVQHFGPADVVAYPQDRYGAMLESGVTGGCYRDPETVGGVQLHNAEEHYLAVFADEASMRAGAQVIAEHFGDMLPALTA